MSTDSANAILTAIVAVNSKTAQCEKSIQVMKLAGIEQLPIESHVLQAFVTEGLKPLVDTVITFGAGHFYVSQSDKGGLVFGGDIDNKYERALRKLGIEPAMLSNEAGHA